MYDVIRQSICKTRAKVLLKSNGNFVMITFERVLVEIHYAWSYWYHSAEECQMFALSLVLWHDELSKADFFQHRTKVFPEQRSSLLYQLFSFQQLLVHRATQCWFPLLQAGVPV